MPANQNTFTKILNLKIYLKNDLHFNLLKNPFKNQKYSIRRFSYRILANNLPLMALQQSTISNNRTQNINKGLLQFERTCSSKCVPENSQSITRSLPFNEIPKSPRIRFLGSLPYFLRKGGQAKIHEYADDLHQKLGPIFIDKILNSEILFIAQPDASLQVYRSEGPYPEHFVFDSWKLFLQTSGMKRGLFFMDGPEWFKYRQILNKVMMQPRSIDSYFDSLWKTSEELMQLWKTFPPREDLQYHMYSWNLESIGEIVLGKHLGFLENLCKSKIKGSDMKDDEFVYSIHQAFIESSNLYSIPAKLARRLRLPAWKRFSKAVSTSLEYGYRYLENGIEELKSNEEGFNKNSLLYKLLVENKMSDFEAKILLVDLFLASADTTSNAAIWIFYLLGKNPEIAMQARNDLLVRKQKSGVLSCEDVGNNSFLRRIIKETFRLYPVAAFLTRSLARDTILYGYSVPAGTMVVSSLYTMGRNPQYFDNPDEFNPDRWLRSDDKEQLKVNFNKKASTPWGLGARSCVGKRVAELELLTLIASALLNFEWTVKESVDMELKLVSVPSKNVVLDLRLLS